LALAALPGVLGLPAGRRRWRTARSGAMTGRPSGRRRGEGPFLLAAQEVEKPLGQLGWDLVQRQLPRDVHGALAGLDEADARGAQLEVDVESAGALGRKVALQVVDQEVDAFLTARDVRVHEAVISGLRPGRRPTIEFIRS